MERQFFTRPFSRSQINYFSCKPVLANRCQNCNFGRQKLKKTGHLSWLPQRTSFFQKPYWQHPLASLKTVSGKVPQLEAKIDCHCCKYLPGLDKIGVELDHTLTDRYQRKRFLSRAGLLNRADHGPISSNTYV
jgi:hypothetical protein